MHAERGLAALRQSSEVEMATVLAWMVLQLPLLDYDASLLCQILMSTDATTRARADTLLDDLGPDAARAAFRLALMRQEDQNSAVRTWVEVALRRLDQPGLAELQRVSAAGEPWSSMLQPTIEWLEQG